jgi:hypothetical protein
MCILSGGQQFAQRRMPFSGVLRRVALVRTDVSEERIASTIRVTRIVGLGTLAATSNRSTLRRNTALMLEAIRPSETLVLTPPRLHIRVDCILLCHRRENFKSYKRSLCNFKNDVTVGLFLRHEICHSCFF